jgi:hypothetical protein
MKLKTGFGDWYRCSANYHACARNGALLPEQIALLWGWKTVQKGSLPGERSNSQVETPWAPVPTNPPEAQAAL